MHAINRARVGTSPAAKRMEAVAQAAETERTRQAEQRRLVAEDRARQVPDQRQAELAATLDRHADWTARQIEAWSEREPDVVITTASTRWMTIVREVAAAHGLTVGAMLAYDKAAKVVRARQEAMYRIFDETPMSYPAIGRRLGGRDHTTILHGVRAHAARNGLPIPRRDGEDAA